MKTNDAGEATFRWFPIWETHGAYVRVADPNWVMTIKDLETADDGALVMKVKRRVARKPLCGKVSAEGSNVAGMLVKIGSYQGEVQYFSDHVFAFTDAEGNFRANIIPGSTYCVHVDDAVAVSDTIDLIPYEPDTDRSNVAELKLLKGELVEIHASAGPSRAPMRNEWVYVREGHRFSWYENGERRNGTAGRGFGVNTNDEGVAVVRAPAGAELEISVNAGEWRSEEKTVNVQAGAVTTVEFHRAFDVERTVVGQLVAPPGIAVDLANAEVTYGSLDGNTDEEETVRADAQGRFAIETKASLLGFFGYAADGSAAGIAKPENLDDPVELVLAPTANLQGRLLGDNDEPLAYHTVRVSADVVGIPDSSKTFSTSFAGRRFEARTDANGAYTFENLPTRLDMTLQAEPIDGSDYDAYLDDFILMPGEKAPPLVSRLSAPEEPERRPLAERYRALLRDAKLGGYHLLVIVAASTSDDFVGRYLTDSDRTKQAMSFMTLNIREDDVAEETESRFVDSQQWPHPQQGTV
ncbi:MAG: hypothetical protein AAF961_09895, partial [Planctomycetota bacterium]